MADAITIKALQDASLDAKSLEEVVNGNESKQVTTRKGETYPSVKKAIKTLFENGGLPSTPFKTKALLTASSLVDGQYAQVTDDTVNNGLYVKTSGAWVKSSYDPSQQTFQQLKKEPVVVSKADLDTEGRLWENAIIEGFGYSFTSKYFEVDPLIDKVNVKLRVMNNVVLTQRIAVAVQYDSNKTKLPIEWQNENRVYAEGNVSHTMYLHPSARYIRFFTMNQNHELYEDHTFEAVIRTEFSDMSSKVNGFQQQLDNLTANTSDIYPFSVFKIESSTSTNVSDWVDTKSFKHLLFRTALSGLGAVVEYKLSKEDTTKTLITATNSYSFYFGSVEIPSEAAYIRVKTRKPNVNTYVEGFSGVFLLADSAEEGMLRLAKYCYNIMPEIRFAEANAVTTIPNTENLVQSTRMTVIKGTTIYFKTDKAESPYGYTVSTGYDFKRDVIELNDENTYVIASGKYAGYRAFKTTFAGFVSLYHYDKEHAKYNPVHNFNIVIEPPSIINKLPNTPVVQDKVDAVSTGVSFTGDLSKSIHLKAVRHVDFKDKTTKIPVQYLWYDDDYNFYISNSKRGARHLIFKWDYNAMHNNPPHNFAMNFDYYGNIICAYRIEQLSYSLYSDDVRRNPIVLEKESGYSANEVPFAPVIADDPDMIRPSGWFSNSGFIATKNEIVFSEYTRPSVQTANTWRVSYPITDPNNWVRSQSFEISTEVNPTSGFKHLHSVDLDPFTGHIYTSSGDAGVGAGIYVSTDNARTFITISSGVEAISRLLGFVFKEDYIWWATDSHGDKHRLYKAPRLPDSGIMDIDNIEQVLVFPTESEATYATIYFENLDALMFLGRSDFATTSIPIEVWDFKNNTLQTVGTVESVTGTQINFGFRCECYEYTPRDNEMICGFSTDLGSASTYINKIKGFGNTGVYGTTVNNLTFSLQRDGDKFYLGRGTVF